jgi:hypothetical protein
MRQVKIGQTQTTIKNRRRTRKNKISPGEIPPADLDEEGGGCIGASLTREKHRVQMQEI